MSVLLALDQGTTSTRAILFGPDLLPRAVELTVTQSGGPEYRYVFLVGAGV